ncbi:MAG: hypothetical protein CVT88_03380 [Candidatus Altiarchaeales archaeon HGW-Altiarchaeales-1]|nr:MAG: hypothetical protein CVT89_05045 [Candidatus Altiarchaeales archaeon HGW-Altiarchaeales-2]PKP60333.1 MAG: hypothetical protein CVT88_03380 [Candidatus Altiarchaeales archaeon HGW-Altiarchaeales-1]
MEQKLTLKDTKTDMIKAYDELLAKYKEKEQEDKSTGKETEAKNKYEKTLIERTSNDTVESIVKGLTDLKLDLSKTLSVLSDKLTSEANKLGEIQEAITIETKNLEEIHDIKLAAETLGNLISTHERKKKASEEEITAMRAQWEKEQEEHQRTVKERDEKVKKEREREAEEYNYTLTLSRKKEKDAYGEEKAALKKALKEERESQENELSEREIAVASQEKEIAEIRTKASSFPGELAKAVSDAKKESTELSENRAKQKADLLAKEIEGEKKLAELKIKHLEETAAKQTGQIKDLMEQLNKSNLQVQSIATQAIEGASGAKALSSINEIALEQAKNAGAKK